MSLTSRDERVKDRQRREVRTTDGDANARWRGSDEAEREREKKRRTRDEAELQRARVELPVMHTTRAACRVACSDLGNPSDERMRHELRSCVGALVSSSVDRVWHSMRIRLADGFSNSTDCILLHE